MGRPRLIILIRHGESEGNCDKSVNRHISNHAIPLTALGERQAREAGERLKTMLRPEDSILFYTSPYRRTRQTTDGILSVISKGTNDYKVREEPRLREQDFGNFQPEAGEMERIWLERANYGHFFYRIPNGESAADVYDRCSGFNETLFRQFNNDKFPSVLVLVTHGIWARVFLMKWFRWTYERFETLRNLRHCEFIVMRKPEASHKYTLLNRLRTWDDEDNTKNELTFDIKDLDREDGLVNPEYGDPEGEALFTYDDSTATKNSCDMKRAGSKVNIYEQRREDKEAVASVSSMNFSTANYVSHQNDKDKEIRQMFLSAKQMQARVQEDIQELSGR
ncbi:phosphoglycerate mutase-like protein [Nadsonia fulvescens var. elongata DSM 6958]|uniref:Phosphoglycerate mutase-like protein n=1 Tax=Nadsonia fulvescens var. elongata DSM 6958 TaxID=857566 RepID=A0A1E3PQV3_9ASCO|nr:phosphoglycerate mutase-like protein [Nadsonia fulvescens var. elongata DSM 6958]